MSEKQGFEDFCFAGENGTLAVRVHDSGKVELGVQPRNAPEKIPEVMIELPLWMQRKLIETIGQRTQQDYEMQSEQLGITIDALERITESISHVAATAIADRALDDLGEQERLWTHKTT